MNESIDGGRGCARTVRGSGASPNFETYSLAEREKSRKFVLCAATGNPSRSFRTASVEGGRPSPRFLESAAPIGGDAYAGMSSTMRPSLQPYLASKSAFTVAPS
jgi:hypothetical protein